MLLILDGLCAFVMFLEIVLIRSGKRNAIRRVPDDDVEGGEAEHPLGVEEGGGDGGVVGIPFGEAVDAGEALGAEVRQDLFAEGLVLGAEGELFGAGVGLDILGAEGLELGSDGLDGRGDDVAFAVVEADEGVGDDEVGFEVGELVEAGVGLGGVRGLVAEEGDEEAELGDLDGDGLDVHAIDTLPDEVELDLVDRRLAILRRLAQLLEEADHAVEEAHGEGAGAAGGVDGLEGLQAVAKGGFDGLRQGGDGDVIVAEEDVEGRGVGDGGEGGAEGLVDHVVDDLARGVEGAGGLAGGFPGLGVVGGKEIFEGLAEELRVKGDVGVGGVVFVDGEVVALEEGEEAAGLVEEEGVGEEGAPVRPAGEAVAIDLAVGVGAILRVEALEESAVEIGDGREDPQDALMRRLEP